MDKTVRIWNYDTGKPVLTATGHTEGVMAVDYSPDGAFVVSGSNDWSIRVWDVITGTIVTL